MVTYLSICFTKERYYNDDEIFMVYENLVACVAYGPYYELKLKIN